MFKHFSVKDLLYIAIMAAMGLAIKPIVTPLIHLISAPLMIPGGSLAGGFYMLWLVLAKWLVPRFWSGFIAGLAQAIIVLLTGIFGSHGILSIVSYTLPGLMIDLFYLIPIPKNVFKSVILGIAANCTGSIFVSLLLLRLPFIPIITSLALAAISGALGGWIAWFFFFELKKNHIIQDTL